MKNFWQKKYIKEVLGPERSFDTRLKSEFLERYDKRYDTATRRSGSFVYLARLIYTGAAAVFLFTSLSVYAVSSDVGFGSALYPLKRAYESFEYKIADKEERDVITVKQAERRVKELQETDINSGASTRETLIKESRESVSRLVQVLDTSELPAETVSDSSPGPMMMSASHVADEVFSLEEPSQQKGVTGLRQMITDNATGAPKMTAPYRGAEVLPGGDSSDLREESSETVPLPEIERFEIESSRLKYQREVCEKSKNLFRAAEQIIAIDMKTYELMISAQRVCEASFGEVIQ